ncbi:hypothetical protein HKX48_006159 [Thoreauomyces humboldtii]|nr:hypothetical protein HKX48_006159 [Thoreauomyces humboldtii]
MGDFYGQNFQFRASVNGSPTPTGTLAMHTSASPLHPGEAHTIHPSITTSTTMLNGPNGGHPHPAPPPPPPTPLFPEKWNLRVDPAFLTGSSLRAETPGDLSIRATTAATLSLLPPEMYLSAALIVCFFLGGERRAVSQL